MRMSSLFSGKSPKAVPPQGEAPSESAPAPAPQPRSAPSGAPSQPPARRYIKDLNPTERIRGIFSIANAQLGKTRQDKPYLRCIVGDRTGELPARMWSIDEATFRRLPTDGFAYLEGETQPYQGELQLIIHTIEPADPSPEEMKDLLPCTKRDIGAMFQEVTELLGTLKHPAMKALAKAYLEDAYLMDAFRQAPAAKSMHHAYLGGLLEHTLTLMQLANLICPLYPKINRDIVLLGLFLHDLGKTRELIYDRAFGYSDRGELIGHIVEGAVMLHDKAQQVMREQGIRMPPAPSPCCSTSSSRTTAFPSSAPRRSPPRPRPSSSPNSTTSTPRRPWPSPPPGPTGPPRSSTATSPRSSGRSTPSSTGPIRWPDGVSGSAAAFQPQQDVLHVVVEPAAGHDLVRARIAGACSASLATCGPHASTRMRAPPALTVRMSSRAVAASSRSARKQVTGSISPLSASLSRARSISAERTGRALRPMPSAVALIRDAHNRSEAK